MQPTPDDKYAEARRTIAQRRHERERNRERVYTLKQKRIRAAYARKKRQNHRAAWNSLKRFNGATRRGESWLAGSKSAGRCGGTVLIRPTFCGMCGRFDPCQQLEAHHFQGYEPETSLLASVVWICRQCHSASHTRMREAELLGFDPNDGFREFVLMMRAWAKENSQLSELPALPAGYSEFSGADPSQANTENGENNREK
jgi:hypothetical protein